MNRMAFAAHETISQEQLKRADDKPLPITGIVKDR